MNARLNELDGCIANVISRKERKHFQDKKSDLKYRLRKETTFNYFKDASEQAKKQLDQIQARVKAKEIELLKKK